MSEAEIQAAAADVAAENTRAVLSGIIWADPPLPGTLARDVWEML